MGRRIRRKWLNARQVAPTAIETLTYPLGDRPIPDGQQDAHHLVPKSRGGRQTQFLHRICHRQIHALLTETELTRRYSSVDALLGSVPDVGMDINKTLTTALLCHPKVARWVAWVKGKPDDFSHPPQPVENPARDRDRRHRGCGGGRLRTRPERGRQHAGKKFRGGLGLWWPEVDLQGRPGGTNLSGRGGGVVPGRIVPDAPLNAV